MSDIVKAEEIVFENLDCTIKCTDEAEKLRCLVMKGYDDRYSIKADDHRDKALALIDRELNIIENMKLSDLFLTVYDIVSLLKSAEISVGAGRGAVPESIVNYCLGITDVDPIQFNLVFERFINPDRNQKPFFTLEIPQHNVKLLRGFIEKCYPCYFENIEILPLRTVEIIADTLDYIKASYDREIDLQKLDYFDHNVYKAIATEDCEDTLYNPEVMREFAPQNLEEVAAAIAMDRVGSREFVSDYLKAKNSSKDDISGLPFLREITSETYGNLIYQEQVMRALHDLAGFSLIQSDNLRRSLSKQKIMEIENGRKSFIYGNSDEGIEGCIAKDISEETADEIYSLLVERTKYTLNKSHYIAYAKMIYQQAWLKYHYPKEYCEVFKRTNPRFAQL